MTLIYLYKYIHNYAYYLYTIINTIYIHLICKVLITYKLKSIPIALITGRGTTKTKDALSKLSKFNRTTIESVPLID